MFKKIKQFILKIKCRKIYKQLPTAVKMQLYLEMCQPQNKDITYSELIKREFELRKENATIKK